jgi:glycosyltransferase involved in cell wall biosynthesis
MKIAIDTSCLLLNPNSGLSEVVRNLVSELPLVEKGNQFVLFYNHFRAIKQNHNNHIPYTFKHILRIPRRLMNWSWKHNWTNIDFLLPKANIYHSLHIQIPPSNRLKKILTVHDCRYLSYPDLYPPKEVEDYHKLMNISLERSDMVTAVSNFTRGELLTHFAISEKKIKVIHNGFRPYFSFKNDSHEKLKLLTKKKKLPSTYLLFIGVLDPRKNLRRLIEALAILKNEERDIPDLIIAGISPDKWNKSNEAKIAEQLGFTKYIHVIGVVSKENLFCLMKGALALCYPSLYEGFGFPPLEAMSQGIPVLASKITSIPEITGRAACLVNPISVDSIARGLQKIVFDNEYRQKLIKSGFDQIKKFSWRQAAAEYIQVYKKVLGT